MQSSSRRQNMIKKFAPRLAESVAEARTAVLMLRPRARQGQGCTAPEGVLSDQASRSAAMGRVPAPGRRGGGGGGSSDSAAYARSESTQSARCLLAAESGAACRQHGGRVKGSRRAPAGHSTHAGVGRRPGRAGQPISWCRQQETAQCGGGETHPRPRLARRGPELRRAGWGAPGRGPRVPRPRASRWLA